MFAFVTTQSLYIHMYIANGFSLRILIVYRHICFIGSREGSLYFGVAFFLKLFITCPINHKGNHRYISLFQIPMYIIPLHPRIHDALALSQIQ